VLTQPPSSPPTRPRAPLPPPLEIAEDADLNLRLAALAHQVDGLRAALREGEADGGGVGRGPYPDAETDELAFRLASLSDGLNAALDVQRHRAEREAAEREQWQMHMEEQMQERLRLAKSESEATLAEMAEVLKRSCDDEVRSLKQQLRERDVELQQLRARTRQGVMEQVMRRTLRRDLHRGFQSWRAMWIDRLEQLRLLRRAASGFRSPVKVAALREWRQTAADERRERERREIEEFHEARLQEQLALAHSESERQMAIGQAAAAAKQRELERALDELDREKLAELEQQRQRAEAQHRKSILRMRNLEIARMFRNWVEVDHAVRAMRSTANRISSPSGRALNSWTQWAEDLRQLRQAASSWHKPRLTASLRHWRQVTSDLRQAQYAAEVEERSRALLDDRVLQERRRAEQVLAEQRAEHERALRLLEQRLAHKEAESQSEKQARELADRRAQEHAMRRILNLELARSFRSWAEWLDNLRRLNRAASQLRSPEQTRGIRKWTESVYEPPARAARAAQGGHRTLAG